MSESAWYTHLTKAVPGFDTGRFRWIVALETGSDALGRNARLVLEYANQLHVTLLVRQLTELPTIPPASSPGVLPYRPFDLGEFLIAEFEDRIVLYDELKGWRIVGGSLTVERVEPLPTPKMFGLVRLLADCPAIGMPAGAIGTVIEVFEQPRAGYEVEFTDDQGRTVGQGSFFPEEIRVVVE